MTHTEAEQLARSLVAWDGSGRARITASVIGDRIVFGGEGARSGTHSLDIGSSSRDRVLAHWRGFVTTNGGVPIDPPTSAPTPPPTRKTPPAQLDREIAAVLSRPAPVAPRTPHIRRMVVVAYWGDGKRQLGEFTGSDRYARAWSGHGQRWLRSYEIDTQQKPTGYGGRPIAPGESPTHGVKSVRPATLKDLKSFHFKLPEGHTLADSPELDVERANNCSYCGKPTRKGSALIDGQSAHKSCIKEFED